MRYVDFYTNDSTKHPVTFDCKQLGKVVLTRTPNAKRFTMADGSPCMYTARKDAAAFTLRLECGSVQAAAIAQHARLGSFVIAGMSYGMNRRGVPQETAAYLPEQYGVTGYVTGAVQVEEISSGADLYTVTIPMQIVVNQSGTAETVPVPAVKILSLSIDRHPELIRDSNYRYQPTGTFIRKQMLHTDFSEIAISCTASVPDGAPLLITVGRNGETLLTGDAALDGMLPLLPGRNDFVLTAKKANDASCKPEIIRFSVYWDDTIVLCTEYGGFLITGNEEIMIVKG